MVGKNVLLIDLAFVFLSVGISPIHRRQWPPGDPGPPPPLPKTTAPPDAPHRRVPPPLPPGAKPDPRVTTSPATLTPSTSGSRTGARVRGAPTGVGRRRARTSDYDRWESWWAYNGEALLGTWRRPVERGVVSGFAGFLVGRGPTVAAPLSRPNAADVRERIVPALLAALREGETKVIESAVIALGRMVRAEDGGSVLRAIATALVHPQNSVKESAILALGILGSRDGRPFLRAILDDTPRGRSALRSSGSISVHLRAVATIALGMIGARADAQALMDVIEREPPGSRELKECAVVALGLFGDDSETDIIPYLMALLDRRECDRTARAFVPIALARLGGSRVSHAAVVPLVRMLDRPGDSERDLRRSCLIALGKLGSMRQVDLLETLYRVVQEDRDTRSRLAAIIALGEIGGRDSSGLEERHRDHARLMSVLLGEVRRPKYRVHRPWAAISAALYGRELSGTRPRLVRQIGERLLDEFRRSNDPRQRGALALSLGLIDCEEAQSPLLDDLRQTHDASLTRYLAQALGLLGSTEGRRMVRRMIGAKQTDPSTRVALARGLALMGEAETGEILTDMLAGSRTVYETAGLAQAIGVLGDRTAIGRLVAILADPVRPVACRDYAAAALGLLAEKTRLRWNVRVTAGLNSWIPNETLALVADLL